MGKIIVINGANFATNKCDAVTIATNSAVISLAANIADYGEVSGGGTYEIGKSATISAVANDGYYFAKWSDGSTDATRTFKVTEDLSLTAIFAKTLASVFVLTIAPPSLTTSSGSTTTNIKGVYYVNASSTAGLRATTYPSIKVEDELIYEGKSNCKITVKSGYKAIIISGNNDTIVNTYKYTESGSSVNIDLTNDDNDYICVSVAANDGTTLTDTDYSAYLDILVE